MATVEQAAASGYSGIKHMTRIDLKDPATARALELLGEVLASATHQGLEALVESLSWRDGVVNRSTDGIVYAAVVTHDIGAPLLKVPVPADTRAGSARVAAISRIVASVGVPVLFLGGSRPSNRSVFFKEVADVIAGGAAGMVIGRAIFQDPDPALMARLVADLVYGRHSLDEVLEAARSSTPVA